MVKLTVLYGHPDDPDAFEEYYADTHMPLVDKMPTLRGTRRPGSSLHQTVASHTTTASSRVTSRTSMSCRVAGTPEGQAAAEDIPNFATGGATLLICEIDA